MDLSTEMGNKVLNHYEEQSLVCPPSLKLNLFTTSALDNIDHNPRFTTSEDSFHGTGVSLSQHQDHKDDGLDQDILESAQMEEKRNYLTSQNVSLKSVLFQSLTIILKLKIKQAWT